MASVNSHEFKAPRKTDLHLGDLIFGMAVDLKIVLAFIVLMLVFILAPGFSQSLIRQVSGLVMILFVPGYAFVALLFPGKAELQAIERFLMAFVFSIVAVALTGLGLNYTPWGIHIVPVTIVMTIFILACVALANWRRHDLPEASRFSLSLRDLYWRFSQPYRATIESGGNGISNKVLNIILIASVLLVITTLAYAVVLPKQGATFTEFYITGANGKADNYPTSVVMGNSAQVIVGAVNHEQQEENYNLIVSLNNSTNKSVPSKILYTEAFSLADNQTWQKRVEVKPNMTGDDMKLMYLLYKDGNMTAPYRELHLWINVTAPGGK